MTYTEELIGYLKMLEKEHLIKPKRTKGGTRIYSEKDINTIIKILDLQNGI